LAKDRELLGEGRQFISDRTLDQVHANADIAKADLGVAEANRDERIQGCSLWVICGYTRQCCTVFLF
jgi:hypothetical protein